MQAPYEAPCCNGGSCTQTPTSDSDAATHSMSSTLTAHLRCRLCLKYWVTITDTMVQWPQRARDGISTSKLTPKPEIARECSEAKLTIEGLVDTWWLHLQSTHPEEHTAGMLLETLKRLFLRSLPIYGALS